VAGLCESGQHFPLFTSVKDLSVSQNQDIIEELEESRSRLMNHTNNYPAIVRQSLQMANHLVAAHTIQSAGGLIEEHNGRIRYQLNANGQALVLASG